MSIKQVSPHKNWPSGRPRPIAMLKLTWEELAWRYGITFEERYDDLDYYQLAALEDAEIGEFWLTQYKNNPVPGTEVWVDSTVDISKAQSVLLTVLDLKPTALIWTLQ